MTPPSRPGHLPLAAAVGLFAERGYAGVSDEHLCQAMALDSATFQRRYTDKQGCFLAACDHLLAVTHASVVRALPARAPWGARLVAGLHCLFELIDANPAAARLVLLESPFAGEAALQRYTATLESLAPFMREGRQCPTAPEQLPPIADSVLPAGVAFTLRCQLLRGEPARDLYPEMLRFLLLPYLGQAETEACLAQSSPRSATG
jgi:AcrR family transcriptional regulator